MKWTSYLTALLALLTGAAHALEFFGPIGAGAEGLRFSAGASSARVSVAVAKTTDCSGYLLFATFLDKPEPRPLLVRLKEALLG